MSSVRRAIRLPLAALLLIIPASLAVAVVPDRTPPVAERGEAAGGDGAVAGEDGRLTGDHGGAPTVDVATEREDLLAAGRAVDAGGVDPGLQAALESARGAAAAAGLEIPVASAYRSPEEQLDTLEESIAERGSVDEALRWVFTPDRSMHVRGLAIDVNSGPAADWLSANGDGYGLCRTLDWEWWHFEWRQRWQDDGSCPTPATTPADAPPA